MPCPNSRIIFWLETEKYLVFPPTADVSREMPTILGRVLAIFTRNPATLGNITRASFSTVRVLGHKFLKSIHQKEIVCKVQVHKNQTAAGLEEFGISK